MLAGPTSNPASLPTCGTSSIQDLLSQIFLAATATQHTPTPVRFLSRYDKSANNIRESSLWTSIGQTPWSEPYSHWYHRYVAFPLAALKAASILGEYTLVDRGTWYAVGEEGKSGLRSYVSLMFRVLLSARGLDQTLTVLPRKKRSMQEKTIR